jgi:hypothetical protein
MTETTRNDVNKEEFPDGSWMKEPDSVKWTDEKTGYPCRIMRCKEGILCGYVAVSQNHPCCGIGYHNLNSDFDFDPHGGFTFSMYQIIEDKIIWWVGFDCGHSNDIIPLHTKDENIYFEDESYKTIEFVKNEVTILAQKLKEIEEKN